MDIRRTRTPGGVVDPLPAGLAEFLRARLREELAALWDRHRAGEEPGRPGLAAQVAVLDETLVALDTGTGPTGLDLRLLLHCYTRHPAFDPAWTGR